MPSSRKTAITGAGPHGPLVFNTRALSRRPGSLHTETRTVPAPAHLFTGMAHVPLGADLKLYLRFESVTEGVLVTVTAIAPVAGECARCLEPVASGIEVACQELFSYDQEAGDGQEDGYSLDGGLLDLEAALRDALVLALPLAPRCQENCPGLCVECGVRLAQAGPGHRHDSTVDPRWEGLQQFVIPAGPAGGALGEENGRGRP